MDTNSNIIAEAVPMPIGSEQLTELTRILQKYKAGKSRTESRIIASENWWKLRNTNEEQKSTAIGTDGGFTSQSGWLHNVIVSKHADAMEAFPEPNILPREEGDKAEAIMLTAIVPCVLEQNRFESTYSDVEWQRLKTGTGVYKVVWDSRRLNGLGDICIERVNLLNLYWEPGITDIQKSRYIFQTELVDKDILRQTYPDLLKDRLKGSTFVSSKFLYDDTVDTENNATVIEVYYHKQVNGKNTLQYIKYVEDAVLYATEDEPAMAVTGLYEHCKYPYVFEVLYPIEGSPCGYGYIDLCKNPQTVIDLIKTSVVKNAVVGATPRYFARKNSGINLEQFLNLEKPVVEVNDSSEMSLRPIETPALNGNHLSVLNQTIQELRETSGNTETSTGNASGVTAASAIAALQEASGKGSRDATREAYRAYSELVEMCIELIRQFYDMPRQFRILGEYGAEQYVSYTNANIKPQYQGNDFGADMGYRLPVFDIKVSAQRKSAYTKVAQNELAIQFFQLGFFNPQMTDQALMCLEIMDFDGKDSIMQKISRNGTMYEKLAQYMKISLLLARASNSEAAQAIAQDISQTFGGGAGTVGGDVNLFESDDIGGIQKEEPAIVRKARERSAGASQPNIGG